MNRYFLELSFKGTHFHGWQIQPNAPTVQSHVEEALVILTRKRVKTTGAGRTDTGVHARYFVAHLDSDCQLFNNRSDFLYKINALLPPDIAINNIYSVMPNAHARYSALSRTYEYTISQVKDPFDTEFSWHYSVPLDLTAMNQSAGILPNYTDFTSFSKLHSNAKTNICHIDQAVWSMNGTKVVFHIRADRFLRNMVRAMVGTLTDVGRGKLSQSEFIGILEGRSRSLAGFSAPAEGLALIAIEYPLNIKV
jgi:tRNA pseudouridine38-40 synthase